MNIFVGNLDFGTTGSTIRSLFERYGKVESVNIIIDRGTGHSRGFGFVEMTNHAEAKRAMEALNGTVLGGRALNVSEAHPKTDRRFDGDVYRGDRDSGHGRRLSRRW